MSAHILHVCHLSSAAVPATAVHCCCSRGQRLVVLREMEEFSIPVEFHLGQCCVPPSPASQSQDIPFKHGVWLHLEAQPGCETWEQGHPGAAGPSVHFLPLSPSLMPPAALPRNPPWDGGSWSAPSQLSLSPRPSCQTTAGLLLSCTPPSSLLPLPFSSIPPSPPLLSLCLLSGLFPSYPPCLLFL